MSIYHTNILRKCFFNELICSFKMFWMDLWTHKRFHLFSRQYLHTARAVSLCKLWFHIQDILLLCVQLGLYRTSHSFISCFTASYCIVLHYCMAYWRFILVSNWCSAPHCCCTVVLHGQQKNGFRLKSNWLKYTIFPRPSFKSCFKKEKKESAGQCRLTLKTWWPHKQDCLCSWASLRWNAVRKFNAVLPDGQEYYTQMSWHASL